MSSFQISGTLGFCSLAAAVGLLAAQPSSAEEAQSAADVGRAYYQDHCQVCHGPDGRGQGAFTGVLTTPPPDLTTIAARRSGDFPSLEIAEIIDGTRTLGAHGTSEMPVWGARFRELAATAQGEDNALRGRVYLLVEYLRSLQTGVEMKKSAAAAEKKQAPSAVSEIPTLAELGREPFLQHCSTCHGREGRGDGPMKDLLKDAPLDLTAIAERRGGTFSGTEIAEIIDGRRDLTAHGTRSMPVWGVEFGRNRGGTLGKETAIRGDIHLLVEYLRSIQQN
ncbi:MAG: c-type cytochrome [Myxococcales bacterium]|nr:c-type cytochrome [Myxococcales bacterium]